MFDKPNQPRKHENDVHGVHQVEYSFNYAAANPKEDWLGVIAWGDEPTADTCVLRRPLLESSSGTVWVKNPSARKALTSPQLRGVSLHPRAKFAHILTAVASLSICCFSLQMSCSFKNGRLFCFPDVTWPVNPLSLCENVHGTGVI